MDYLKNMKVNVYKCLERKTSLYTGRQLADGSMYTGYAVVDLRE